MCGGQMRLSAFITEGAQIKKILDHIGVDSQAPRIFLAYPRHAGHRCGMRVMRRWARVSKSSQTGIWRRNPHPTMRSISASTGDWATRRFGFAAGSPCIRHDPRAGNHDPGQRILVGDRPGRAWLREMRGFYAG